MLYYYIWSSMQYECEDCGYSEIRCFLTKVKEENISKEIKTLTDLGYQIISMIMLPSDDDNEFRNIEL